MRNLAIIPARSGSKGVKDKNIRGLCGKPLMAYAIDAANESGQFDTVMVSTDSEDYAVIAREYDAEVPFLRSAGNANDAASTWDTVEEVISKYKKRGQDFDSFCVLQPTSPLRTAEDIIDAYKIYIEQDAFSVVSMTELEHPIDWCGRLGANDSLDGFINREDITQRQTKPKYYRPNGAIYIANIEEFLSDKYLYRGRAYAYIMPQERSIDIDSELDLKLAELMINEATI